jgi:hypothetical protein
MRMWHLLTAGLFVCLASVAEAQFQGSSDGSGGSSSASAFAPSTDQITNGGLGVRVLFVGRNPDGKSLTVSAELQNVMEEPAYLALVGPAPAAIDTQGVTYSLSQHAGLASCSKLDNGSIARCFANFSGYLPGESFSLLQPGAAAIVALTFASEQASDSGFLSVTLNVALGKGERPTSSRDNDHGLENVAISFPLIELKSE